LEDLVQIFYRELFDRLKWSSIFATAKYSNGDFLHKSKVTIFHDAQLLLGFASAD
jgi:hypothetical protein